MPTIPAQEKEQGGFLKTYGPLLLWIIVFELVSMTIGRVTQGGVDGWYATLTKPAFTPPNILFPIMWTILYALIAAAGWVLWRRRHEAGGKTRLALFAVYMALNWSWSFVFFSAQQLGLGLLWILAVDAVALLLIICAWRPARPAALLMIPALLWTSYASWIAYGVWVLN